MAGLPLLSASKQIHNLADLDVSILARVQVAQVDVKVERDIASRQVCEVATKERVSGDDRAGDVPKSGLVVGSLPFPPNSVEVGVVEVEDGLGV